MWSAMSSIHAVEQLFSRNIAKLETGSNPAAATNFDSLLQKTYERRKNHFPRLPLADPECGRVRRVRIGRHRADRLEFGFLVGFPAVVARADWHGGVEMAGVEVPCLRSDDRTHQSVARDFVAAHGRTGAVPGQR